MGHIHFRRGARRECHRVAAAGGGARPAVLRPPPECTESEIQHVQPGSDGDSGPVLLRAAADVPGGPRGFSARPVHRMVSASHQGIARHIEPGISERPDRVGERASGGVRQRGVSSGQGTQPLLCGTGDRRGAGTHRRGAGEADLLSRCGQLRCPGAAEVHRRGQTGDPQRGCRTGRGGDPV